MAEISNKALALLVLTALVVVVAATTVQLNRLNAIGITGMPTADDGTVVLEIASSVSIEVDTGNSSINFGPCTPLSGQNLTFDSENNMTNATNDRCVPNPVTGQTGFILVRNIGNVDANVTVAASLTPNGFIPTAASNQADFQVRFDVGADCGAGGSRLLVGPEHAGWVTRPDLGCTSRVKLSNSIQARSMSTVVRELVQRSS